ncbi:TRAP transporter small permease subunit [Elioraea sp.]|uniref:TRAP transporter small permease subunit n=1 Tax=Elioraea sp. TaxID=2185103 RepID=UPI0021DCCD7B|nr:TRAP transporter small permease [Elioraea sp.]GIX09275.1 MAG: membrane protein [Elioraea sp.]
MRALRRGLDALYLAGGIAGAVAIVAIGALVLAQVVLRQLGMVIPGGDDLTAFSVAASAMLPLAYAFRHGAHIRVDLIIGHVGGAARHRMEVAALALAVAMALLFAYASFDSMRDSFAFEEVAQGMLAVPIWIPQLAMVVGTALFALALLDDLVVALAGGRPSYRAHEPASAVEKAMQEL